MRCEGDCERNGEHRGEVRRVFVLQPGYGNLFGCEWGEWDYCEAAVEEDERRGFTVTEVRPSGAETEEGR